MAPQASLSLPSRPGRLPPIQASSLWPDDLIDHAGLRGSILAVAIVGCGAAAQVRITVADRDGIKRTLETSPDTMIRRLAP